MTRFDALLCWTLIAATFLVLLFALRPASRPSSQAIPAAPVPSGVLADASRTPATTTGTPEADADPSLSSGTAATLGQAGGVPHSPQSTRTPLPSGRAAVVRSSGAVVSAAPARPAPKRLVQDVAYAIRATWYCGNGSRCSVGHGPGCYCAAISPDLRSWAGSLVRACVGSRCVTVSLIDCNCQAEHGIDLYAVAFRKLAPLSVGVLTVRLERL